MKRGVFIFWGVFVVAALTRLVISLAGNGSTSIPCVKQSVLGHGIITQEPERKESGQVFVVHANQLIADEVICAVDLNIRLKTKLYPRFVYGDQVSFEGKISQPFNFKSPSGRSFDYQGYLAKDDIFYEIKSAKVTIATTDQAAHDLQGANLKNLPTAEANNPGELGLSEKISAILFSIKRSFVSHLEQALGEPHAALAAGLVVGEKSALGSDLLADFRTVGLIHIIVLSGFNITVVGDAMRRLLSFLPRVWGIGIGGMGIILFGVMVGGGATVVRSCFMASIALSADLIRRDYNVTRALIFAGLIMVIQNPTIVFHDPSFQLSFLATLGLILLASPIEKRLGFIPEKFGMRGIVASTVATQIFVSPFILYMMGTMSIIGMVVNILVLPIIPATMLFVFLTGATGFIWMPIAHLFGWVSHILLTYELSMVEWFARIPYASVSVPVFSKWWVVAFYVGFAVMYVGKKYCDRSFLHYKNRLFEVSVTELQNVPDGEFISNPHHLLFVEKIPNKVSDKIGLLKNTKVYISRIALKHIIERRKSKSEWVMNEMRNAILYPTKISDNSLKRKNSFLFLRSNQLIICVVVEKTKTTWQCQIVSAFPIHQKIYKKMIDISGRAEFPPFELSP